MPVEQVLVRMVGVKIVQRVNTVQVVWQMLPVVLIAPLVTVKTIKDKLLASNAAPVNSTMFLVLLRVRCVLQTLIPAAKVEIRRV